MNTGVGRARIGQWYMRWDKGEIFQVVGYDPDANTIETQTFDGDLDEIDLGEWATLPLAVTEPPEDWTGPVDDVERDDLGYSETDMMPADWAQPLRSLREGEEETEAWQDETPQDDLDPEEERAPVEPLALDDPRVAGRLR